jgi:hypothetical protein
MTTFWSFIEGPTRIIRRSLQQHSTDSASAAAKVATSQPSKRMICADQC